MKFKTKPQPVVESIGAQSVANYSMRYDFNRASIGPEGLVSEDYHVETESKSFQTALIQTEVGQRFLMEHYNALKGVLYNEIQFGSEHAEYHDGKYYQLDKGWFFGIGYRYREVKYSESQNAFVPK